MTTTVELATGSLIDHNEAAPGDTLHELPMGDTITILSHRSLLLTKTWLADGTIKPYDNAKTFDFSVIEVRGIVALSALLTRLELERGSCIIRGAFVGDEIARGRLSDGMPKGGQVLRRKALFIDQALHTFLIDVDKFASSVDYLADPEGAALEYIAAHLPACFQGVSFHWQLSNSAGHPSKDGSVRMHLWFWLKTAYTSAALRLWATLNKIETDKSLLDPIQIHYTAAPVIEPGVNCPVKRRSGFFQGEADAVSLEIGVEGVWEAKAKALNKVNETPPREKLHALGLSEEQIKKLLKVLDPSTGFDDWLHVGMALHHETGGSEDGFWKWHDWSTGGANYKDEADCRKHWNSFHAKTGKMPITAKTLMNLAKKEGFDLATLGSPPATADDFEVVVLTPEERAEEEAIDARNAPIFEKMRMDALREAEKAFTRQAAEQITAKHFDLAAAYHVPRRKWLYGRHLIRGFVSATIAAGGVGKSALTIADALAMTTGRDLVGTFPPYKLKVWMFNGEDPEEELQRRIAAASTYHGVGVDDLAGRLFVNSGRDTPICIATEVRGDFTIAMPVVDQLVAELARNSIDVLIIDPFVSSHRVSENNNNAIDAVVKEWAYIADITGCAIDLVHHTRKTGGKDVTSEDARGASALVSAARSVRVLNRMTQTDAKNAGISDNHWLYFSVGTDKVNMAPPADSRKWFKLNSVTLMNGDDGGPGDDVGVVIGWQWPVEAELPDEVVLEIQKAIDGKHFRKSSQAKDWVGHSVAKVLGLDIVGGADAEQNKRLVKDTISKLLKNGALAEDIIQDENRKKRTVIVVKKWATTASIMPVA